MKTSSEPDEYLMGQVSSGNRECLTPLVRRYASPLLTFLTRMTGDRHRAEELFQEAFLNVWTHRKRYRFPRPFKPWLFAIAANCSRAAFRRANVSSVSIDDVATAIDHGPGPVQTAVKTETATQVTQAVAQLPVQQRTVVVLRVWNGMSYAEISQVAGCSEGSARAHMHYALARLRTLLPADAG